MSGSFQGQSSLPSNLVYTNTNQTIPGLLTFPNGIFVGTYTLYGGTSPVLQVTANGSVNIYSPFSNTNHQISGNVDLTTGSAEFSVAGYVNFSNSVATHVINGAINIYGSITTGSVANFNAGNISTSSTTGCAVFAKGIGVGGDSYFSGSVIANEFRLSALNNTPSSSSDTGTLGEIRYDANYIYVCVATNTWKRSPISTW